MGTWLSLIRNMFRRHDFALFKTLRILCRRLAVLFLIAFYLSQYPPVDPYRVQVAWNNKYKSSHAYIKEAFSDTLTRHNLYGGGKSFVIFSSDELRQYMYISRSTRTTVSIYSVYQKR